MLESWLISLIDDINVLIGSKPGITTHPFENVVFCHWQPLLKKLGDVKGDSFQSKSSSNKVKAIPPGKNKTNKVFPKKKGYPQIMNVNRGFHEINHSFWGGVSHCFWFNTQLTQFASYQVGTSIP